MRRKLALVMDKAVPGCWTTASVNALSIPIASGNPTMPSAPITPTSLMPPSLKGMTSETQPPSGKITASIGVPAVCTTCSCERVIGRKPGRKRASWSGGRAVSSLLRTFPAWAVMTVIVTLRIQ